MTQTTLNNLQLMNTLIGVKIVKTLSDRHFYSQQALSNKILGCSCSGTAISAFLEPTLIKFNH